jgi:hypothetical protein
MVTPTRENIMRSQIESIHALFTHNFKFLGAIHRTENGTGLQVLHPLACKKKLYCVHMGDICRGLGASPLLYLQSSGCRDSWRGGAVS